MPEAIVALGEGKRIVGRLRFESDGRRQHSQFEYDDAWLAAQDRFASVSIDPKRENTAAAGFAAATACRLVYRATSVRFEIPALHLQFPTGP